MYTHLGQGINVLRDPPKSPRWRAAALEKRRTLNPVPPFLRGVRGDQTQLRTDQKTCVYTVALMERGVMVILPSADPALIARLSVLCLIDRKPETENRRD